MRRGVGIGRLERIRGREKEVNAKPTCQLRDLPCLILVGGMGTRLRPVVNDLPKPMAPIAGKPFLEYLLRWVGHAGVKRVILCAGYRADKIQEYCGDGDAFGLQISYSLEKRPLGTWGAIRQAAQQLSNQQFLVLNGDSWLQVDLQELLDFHLDSGGIATIAAAGVRDASRFGSIRADSQGKVIGFAEKQTRAAALVNGGIYLFSREALAVAPVLTGSLESDVFPLLVPRGVYAMRVTGYFIDIGIPAEYKRLQREAHSWMQKLGYTMTGPTTC
jgi:D-glycero-alpha-D-manno-heptose 1-phosphate guanylyltransferase